MIGLFTRPIKSLLPGKDQETGILQPKLESMISPFLPKSDHCTCKQIESKSLNFRMNDGNNR
jgi:hypothetical protein